MIIVKIRAIPGALLLLLCSIANASPIQWEFDNVTFEDNGLINGSFVFDFDSGYLTEWEINVSGGDELTYPPFTYTYLTGVFQVSDSDNSGIKSLTFLELDIVPPPSVPPPSPRERVLRITPSQLLDGNTLLVPLSYSSGPSGSYECWNCSPFRTVVSGSLAFVSYRDDIVIPDPWPPDPSAVPVPPAVWLFGTALLGLVGFSKRRKAA